MTVFFCVTLYLDQNGSMKTYTGTNTCTAYQYQCLTLQPKTFWPAYEWRIT